MLTKNKRLIIILLVIAALLLTPLVAMQFTNEVNWTVSDFVIGGGLLLITGLLLEAVLRTVKKPAYRLAICGVILLALFLVWAELAVGLFGTRFAGS